MPRWFRLSVLKIAMVLPIAYSIDASACADLKHDHWTSADHWAWQRLCDKQPADFGSRDEGTPPLADSLSPSFIEDVLELIQQEAPLPVHAIEIRGGRFGNGLSLVGHLVQLPVSLLEVRIEGDLRIERSTFEQMLTMRRVQVTGGLAGREVRALRDLEIIESDVAGDVDLARLDAAGDVRLDRIAIGGHLLLNEATVRGETALRPKVAADPDQASSHPDLMADDASFAGILRIGSWDDISHAPSVGQISLRHAQFERDLHITGIQISKLVLSGINVKRDVEINRIRALGQIAMDRSSIGGETDIDASKFEYRRPIDPATYSRALSFERSRFEGPVRITNSIVSGHMSAYLARFHESFYLGAGSEYSGKVDLSSSEIAGVLDLAGGRYAVVDLKNAKAGQLVLYSPHGRSVLWGGFRSFENRQFAEVTRRTHDQLNLAGASFGRIEDSMLDSEGLACLKDQREIEDPWPATVHIADVAFGQFEGWRPDVDKACRWELHPLTQRNMGWLAGWLSRADGHDSAPYETLAAYFEKHNADDRAAQVREKRWRSEQRRYCSSSEWLRCVATVVYGIVFHYGIGDWRSWAGVATLVFALSLIGKLVLQKDAGFACFDPRPGFLFSFDRLLPIISLDDHHKDIVLRTPWVRWYFAVHTLLGWAIAAFLGAWAARLVE